MSVIDFKEIPQANKGAGTQDTFELFCRDFLMTLGFQIIQHPSRGADGGKDMLVLEVLSSVVENKYRKWLVSCKHTAHSKRGVSARDEGDFYDRVRENDCDGFLGLYSHLPTSGLSEKIQKRKKDIDCIIYDGAFIEKTILCNPKAKQLFPRYFPESFKKYIALPKDRRLAKASINPHTLTTEDIFDTIKAAVIVVEIEKIINRFDSGEWKNVQAAFSEIYAFSENLHIKVRETVIDYLQDISTMTRSSMPTSIAFQLNQLTTGFLPGISQQISAGEIFLIEQAIDIGFNLSYYSLRYLNRLKIAAEGLLLVKYIYLLCKGTGLTEQIETIANEYKMLEDTVKKSHWHETEKKFAQELLNSFKADLDTSSLRLPEFSAILYQQYSKEPD
jgi:hypothetical protein